MSRFADRWCLRDRDRLNWHRFDRFFGGNKHEYQSIDGGDLGLRSQVPISLQKMMDKSIETTADNRSVTFNIAINYGGRHEILQACKSIAKLAQTGELNPDLLDESLFTQYLDTHGLPDPDLLIRTSGEQ